METPNFIGFSQAGAPWIDRGSTTSPTRAIASETAAIPVPMVSRVFGSKRRCGTAGAGGGATWMRVVAVMGPAFSGAPGATSASRADPPRSRGRGGSAADAGIWAEDESASIETEGAQRMAVEPAAPGAVTTDRIYAAVAGIAAVFAIIESTGTPWKVGCILLALVPWLLVVLRVPLPLWAFAVLSLLPVMPVIVANRTGVVMFLTTAASSRIAARSDDRWLVGGVTAVVLVAPFLPGVFGQGWDYGAFYFAFGNAFGVMVGVLLR